MKSSTVITLLLLTVITLGLLLVLFGTGPGCGFSNGDYSKEIAPGWSIHRMNGFDKVIGRTNGTLPYMTGRDLGPLHEYAIIDRVVVAKHFGAKPRNLRPEDRLLEADATKARYLVIDMDTGKVTEPADACPFDVKEWIEAKR